MRGGMGFIGVSDPWNPSVPTEILAAIQRFYAPSRVFYLFSRRQLDSDLVTELYCQRDPLLGSENGTDSELVVILDSSGGTIGAAYLICKLLRANCSRLKVVVPRWAKSAATLICLAADELVLTDVAELGPLDPQVRRPGETGARPVLDEYMALDALRKDVLMSIDLVMQLMIGGTGMDVKDLITPVCTFVSSLMAPVYSRVDPFVYAAHMRSVEISKEYAIRVLQQHVLPGGTTETPQALGQIANQLASGYPCHDFVVDLSELARLGLTSARRVTGKEEAVLRPLVGLSQQLDLIGTWTDTEVARLQVAASREVKTNDDPIGPGTFMEGEDEVEEAAAVDQASIA